MTDAVVLETLKRLEAKLEPLSAEVAELRTSVDAVALTLESLLDEEVEDELDSDDPPPDLLGRFISKKGK